MLYGDQQPAFSEVMYCRFKFDDLFCNEFVCAPILILDQFRINFASKYFILVLKKMHYWMRMRNKKRMQAEFCICNFYLNKHVVGVNFRVQDDRLVSDNI